MRNPVDTFDFMNRNGQEFYVGGREWSERWKEVESDDNNLRYGRIKAKGLRDQKRDMDQRCAETTTKI